MEQKCKTKQLKLSNKLGFLAAKKADEDEKKHLPAGLMLALNIRLTLILNTLIWCTFEDIEQISQRVTVHQLTKQLGDFSRFIVV
ncbi:hypothetical protein T07_6315 [Trichinella nelsoni]|uniref:Uncharacterized protein n=1 Tax=Trichinella nelsoni TaxID=6336 RepID=A0A0V0RHI2_9BILA|nr:hypothetical protein T07_6315 [Trichinella nelsoni]